MEYKPHDYQQFAINYILEHPIAAVILGMGLGKTSIMLTAIEQLIYDSFEVSKVLVVAPLRVARNTWSDEIHKWNHLKHLRYSIVLGSAAERKKALEADADIYIINRENLQWLIEQSGVNFFWDMVVLDELSSFKNWNCKRFKAFMKVRPNVKRVIGLTGTPSSNGLMDLFAEFKCLDMPNCPEWLLPEAKKEWERLADLMNQMGVLTEVDMAAFAAYCQSYARWKEAQEHIDSGGSTFETDKGYQQQTPWVGIANTNQKLMLQAASEFGLTPSSRSRIVAGSAKGKESEDEMEALLGGDS